MIRLSTQTTEAHPKKHLQQSVPQRLLNPEVIAAAGDALPMLLTIYRACEIQGGGGCDLVLADVARDLLISKPTATKWHQKLSAENLIVTKRTFRRMHFELGEALKQPALVAPERLETQPRAPEGAEASLESTLLNDLLIRVRRLEAAYMEVSR